MGFKGNELVAMELRDQFGQRTELTFSQLQRNPQVNPDSFRFEPPKGADVLGEQ
jgi:outer membrane lipoprotein-sorting protein